MDVGCTLVGSETIAISIYIVTFECCHLPQEIAIGWALCLVREYIPKPRLCFKCHKFGHGGVTCCSETAIYIRCSLDAHEERCDREPMCSKCGKAHPASSRDCFYYNLEQETLYIHTKEHVSYVEAKRAARDNLLKPNSRTYADITIGQKRNPGTLHFEKKQPVSHIPDTTQTPQINIIQANTITKQSKPNNSQHQQPLDSLEQQQKQLQQQLQKKQQPQRQITQTQPLLQSNSFASTTRVQPTATTKPTEPKATTAAVNLNSINTILNNRSMTIEKNEIQKKRSSNDVERVARDEQSCKKATYELSAEASHHPLSQPSPILYHPSLPAVQHGATGL